MHRGEKRLHRQGIVCVVLTLGVARGACAGPVDLPGSLPNMVGVGIGSTTQYAGGSDRIVGVLPGLRYTTSSGDLLEWYGPYAQFDFGGETGWQWGPAISLRLGRHDVDDAVVSRIHTIPTTVEGGGFVGYEYMNTSAFPYRLRGELTVTTNAGAVYTGSRISLNGTAWLPLSPRVFVGRISVSLMKIRCKAVCLLTALHPDSSKSRAGLHASTKSTRIGTRVQWCSINGSPVRRPIARSSRNVAPGTS
jgi:hypothetical protein